MRYSCPLCSPRHETQRLTDRKLYLNRHLQWLAFNERVLEEARDTSNPLLERVRLLAISANNLDEFVEIRVSRFPAKD
jgi:polyphosphate kinase